MWLSVPSDYVRICILFAVGLVLLLCFISKYKMYYEKTRPDFGFAVSIFYSFYLATRELLPLLVIGTVAILTVWITNF